MLASDAERDNAREAPADPPKDEPESEALAGEELAGGFLWYDEHKLVEVREVPHVSQPTEPGHDGGDDEPLGVGRLPHEVVNQTGNPDEREEDEETDECWVHKLTIDEFLEVALAVRGGRSADDTVRKAQVAPCNRERVTLTKQGAVALEVRRQKCGQLTQTALLCFTEALAFGIAHGFTPSRSSDSHRDGADG